MLKDNKLGDYPRMRSIANSCLLFVTLALTVVLYIEKNFAITNLTWLKAFFEAAMVGALADWFAVTALFKRPLGLPFPHSAIIPSNQARIAEALGSFVQSNFLSEQILCQKVKELRIAQALSNCLSQVDNRELLAKKIQPLLIGTLNAVGEGNLRRLFGQASQAILKDLEAAPLAAQALEVFFGHEEHKEILQQVFLSLERGLKQHQELLREALRAEMPWYVPNFIHDKVYRDVIQRLSETLKQANADPDHRLRKQLLFYVKELALELREQNQLSSTVNTTWKNFIASPVVAQYFQSVLAEVRRRLQVAIDQKPELLQQMLVRWMELISQGLQESNEQSNELSEALNSLVERMARGLARNYSYEIAGLISETVKSWDPVTLTEKIEFQVGADLQYIRINGTIVGGILGLIIFALESLIS